jgi:hypothetical protein
MHVSAQKYLIEFPSFYSPGRIQNLNYYKTLNVNSAKSGYIVSFVLTAIKIDMALATFFAGNLFVLASYPVLATVNLPCRLLGVVIPSTPKPTAPEAGAGTPAPLSPPGSGIIPPPPPPPPPGLGNVPNPANKKPSHTPLPRAKPPENWKKEEKPKQEILSQSTVDKASTSIPSEPTTFLKELEKKQLDRERRKAGETLIANDPGKKVVGENTDAALVEKLYSSDPATASRIQQALAQRKAAHVEDSDEEEDLDVDDNTNWVDSDTTSSAPSTQKTKAENSSALHNQPQKSTAPGTSTAVINTVEIEKTKDAAKDGSSSQISVIVKEQPDKTQSTKNTPKTRGHTSENKFSLTSTDSINNLNGADPLLVKRAREQRIKERRVELHVLLKDLEKIRDNPNIRAEEKETARNQRIPALLEYYKHGNLPLQEAMDVLKDVHLNRPEDFARSCLYALRYNGNPEAIRNAQIERAERMRKATRVVISINRIVQSVLVESKFDEKREVIKDLVLRDYYENKTNESPGRRMFFLNNVLQSNLPGKEFIKKKEEITQQVGQLLFATQEKPTMVASLAQALKTQRNLENPKQTEASTIS